MTQRFASVMLGALVLACSTSVLLAQDQAACDSLAASPFDASRPAGVAGVSSDAVDVVAGLVACEQALAADPGNARLMFQLGRVKQLAGQTDQAMTLYQTAAGLGSVVAMINLGTLVEHSDPVQARALYRQAADLGSSLGQYNLAVALQDGIGGPVDLTAAIALYEMALAQGDDVSAYNLAVLHDEGCLMPRDVAKAIAYYQRAVDLGNVDAMVNLAHMTEQGDGLAADRAAALALFERAAALGDTDAAAEVRRLAN